MKDKKERIQMADQLLVKKEAIFRILLFYYFI